MLRIAQLTAILILSLWWIHSVLWLPGLMHVVGERTAPLGSSIVRERAYRYVTRGVTTDRDIALTSDELSHLQDVHRLYAPLTVILNSLSIIAWTIVILSVIRRQFLRVVLRDAGMILAGGTALILVAVLLFERAFVWFHLLLFPQGNWAFPESSLLIASFPSLFWMSMTGILAGLCLVLASVYVLVYTLWYERVSS